MGQGKVALLFLHQLAVIVVRKLQAGVGVAGSRKATQRVVFKLGVALRGLALCVVKGGQFGELPQSVAGVLGARQYLLFGR